MWYGNGGGVASEMVRTHRKAHTQIHIHNPSLLLLDKQNSFVIFAGDLYLSPKSNMKLLALDFVSPGYNVCVFAFNELRTSIGNGFSS